MKSKKTDPFLGTRNGAPAYERPTGTLTPRKARGAGVQRPGRSARIAYPGPGVRRNSCLVSDYRALPAVQTVLYRPQREKVLTEGERYEDDPVLRRFQHLGL
jgi:hypothetical protein